MHLRKFTYQGWEGYLTSGSHDATWDPTISDQVVSHKTDIQSSTLEAASFDWNGSFPVAPADRCMIVSSNYCR